MVNSGPPSSLQLSNHHSLPPPRIGPTPTCLFSSLFPSSHAPSRNSPWSLAYPSLDLFPAPSFHRSSPYSLKLVTSGRSPPGLFAFPNILPPTTPYPPRFIFPLAFDRIRLDTLSFIPPLSSFTPRFPLSFLFLFVCATVPDTTFQFFPP